MGYLSASPLPYTHVTLVQGVNTLGGDVGFGLFYEYSAGRCTPPFCYFYFNFNGIPWKSTRFTSGANFRFNIFNINLGMMVVI